jgi:hypothetical protein
MIFILNLVFMKLSSQLVREQLWSIREWLIVW